MVERNAPTPLKLRTVFVSDIHLGFKGCSAELLLDFLHCVEMEYLFLVGDIIDVWSMKKSMFWPQAHNNVVRTILGKAKRGTKVIFVRATTTKSSASSTVRCSATWKFTRITSMWAPMGAAS